MDYIQQAKVAGHTDEQIKSALLAVGWQEADIGDALSFFGGQSLVGYHRPRTMKIVTIAFSAVLLLAGASGAFWYADKNFNWGVLTTKKAVESIAPDNAADWQVYQNEQYGYELKYPKDLEIKGTGIVGFYSDKSINPLSAAGAGKKEMVLSISGFDDYNQQQSQLNNVGIKDQGEIIFSGYQARKLFRPQTADSLGATAYLLKERNIQIVFFGTYFDEAKQNEILSTFKLQPIQTQNISGAQNTALIVTPKRPNSPLPIITPDQQSKITESVKTFNSTNYGFSFSYLSNAKVTLPFNLQPGNFPNDSRQYCFKNDNCIIFIESNDNVLSPSSYSHGTPLPTVGELVRVEKAPITGLTEASWQKNVQEAVDQEISKSNGETRSLAVTNNQSVQMIEISYSDGIDIAFFAPRSQSLISVSYRSSEKDKAQNSSFIKTIISSIKLN